MTRLKTSESMLSDPNHRWMPMINHIIIGAHDPHYAKMMLLDLGYESFAGEKHEPIHENRKKATIATFLG